jgi:tripartite-type tricarboxylate transporter receptor subunit TctC
MRGFFYRSACALTLVLSLANIALCAYAAEQFPTKPVRLIAPYPPGGTSDIIARVVGQKLTDVWGQQMVVDNRAGANGGIGCEVAAKSPADGYTLLIGNMTPIAANPSLYRKLGYDSLRDFAGVSLVAAGPNVLVVNPNVPVKSVQELLALAKGTTAAKPASLNFGSGGAGSPAHLAGELFKTLTGVQMTHVPYKGTVLSVNDLIAGQVQLVFSDAPPALPHVKSGRLRALAVTGAKRTPLMPDYPTVAESGVPGFALDNWWGILVPAGTPKERVGLIHTELVKIMQSADAKSRFANLGVEAIHSTPGEFDAYIRSEYTKLAKVIKDAGAKAD